jgi:hypothetical protein
MLQRQGIYSGVIPAQVTNQVTSAPVSARPRHGELISQTGWRDPAARAASPSVAEMIRSDVLADDDCQIRGVEDYHLVFCSARKPAPA